MVMMTTLVLAALATASLGAGVLPWEDFKAKFGRQYATRAEEEYRRGVYEQNMQRARALARRNPHATFGASEFADLTATEFKRWHSGERYYQHRRAASAAITFSAGEVAAAGGQSIDWRTKGAVTGVKNQGQCGSCWAFSSTGSIEGQWFLAGNPLTSLSEQELVSCDTVDQGCNGGLMDNAWGWLLSAQKGQIVTEASYPYVSGGGAVPSCDLSGKKVGATIDGHKDIAHDETQMAAFVYASGPLSVGVDATSWQTYAGGIMTDCMSFQVDHGVLVVGFDDTNSPPYWIIKNSWGASWGENGYIRVEKGTDQCLITKFPCTSTVAKGPGPGPAPPTPPGPPGPSGTFEQRRCTDGRCTNCTAHKLPLDKCIKGRNGGSLKAQCISDGLLLWNYATGDCSGVVTKTVNPIGVCLADFAKSEELVDMWVTNVCGAGPAPPGPPGPPSSLVQMQCTSSGCMSGCQNHTFPLNKCLKLADGGSAIAKCDASGVLLTEYILSDDCTGASVPDQMPVNKCLQDSDGTYFENFCLSSLTRASAGSAVRLPRSRVAVRA